MQRQRLTNILILGGVLAFVGYPFIAGSLIRTVLDIRCSPSARWDYALPGGGGYSIEYLLYYDYDCPDISSTFYEGVYARRSRFPWPWPETKAIFSYRSLDPHAINITPTGQNTVTVSAHDLIDVILAETHWGTLKIEYNIGSIKNPRPTDPVTTGESWAEKQERLEQHARSQGVRLIREWFPE